MLNEKIKQKIIEDYCKEKGKDVTNELEAILNYCMILNIKVKYIYVGEVRKIQLITNNFKLTINGNGNVIYFIKRNTNLFYTDFEIHCKDIEDEITFFNAILNKN